MTTSFASDNWSGVHPAVLAAIAAANHGHAAAYGNDEITKGAVALLERQFGEMAGIAFVLTGTAANVIALACLLRPHEAVVAAGSAHLNVDEAGAPERFIGSKVIAVPTPDGKLSPELLEQRDWHFGDVHRVQPRVISISQPTELGVCYSRDELHTLVNYAHDRGLLVHMDGARLANAAVSLGCNLSEASTLTGIDALSFGGTKNGLLMGEAVLVRDPASAALLPPLRKQAMQLASKLRFVAAQFAALLTADLWRTNAAHANEMAHRLARDVEQLEGVDVTQPTETNAVFATAPPSVIERLRERFPFDDWDGYPNHVRWMTAWDTPASAVESFVGALTIELAAAR